MKVMKKDKLFDLEIESQIANEIEIMGLLKHTNIIRMSYYFETKEELILLLEYAPQGTLFNKIKERQKYLVKKNTKAIHLNDKMIIKVGNSYI